MESENPFSAPLRPPEGPEEPEEGAPWRVVLFQAVAFLVYQVPAGWLAILAADDPDLALTLWWLGIVGGALWWGIDHRRRGLLTRSDLWRSLRLVLVVHAFFRGLGLVGAAFSPQEDVGPVLVLAIRWLVGSVAGLVLGVTFARPADPPRRAEPRPPTPPRDAFDPVFGGREAPGISDDPYEGARVRWVDPEE